jgi:hypothetical protein
MDAGDVLPNPSDLRSQTQHFLELARVTFDPQLKRGLLGCAFAISQLAECVELKSGKNGGSR